ncbi:hypothetical protein VCHC02C1_3519B, partial [Vibrio cholerae HC-02C1]
NRHDSKVEGF